MDVDALFVYVVWNCLTLCSTVRSFFGSDERRSHAKIPKISSGAVVSLFVAGFSTHDDILYTRNGILSINITYYNPIFIILAVTTCQIAVSCCKYAFVNSYCPFAMYLWNNFV